MKNYFLISLLIISASSFAATYTVTSAVNGTTTDGVSLRWAITQANANPGADLIDFNIAGTPPHIIALTSILPSLTDGGTVIDGSTQPANGFSGVSPKIILQGSTGLSYGIQIDAPNCAVYGLFIKGFNTAWGTGIAITANGNNFTIGTPPCKGNVLSGNGSGSTGSGISISGAVNGGTIQNNKIGTDTTGINALGNGNGIYITGGARNILIGGNNQGEGNLIAGHSGSNSTGIYIGSSKKITVKGNIIGADINGNKMSGINSWLGMYLFSGSDSCIIGGSSPCEGNIIAYNKDTSIGVGGGIEIQSSDYNLVSRNSFYCNGSWGPIQLIGGNGGISSPVINFGSFAGAGGTAPANSTVELYYADTTCGTYCEGQTYFGTANADAAGNWNYSGPVSGGRAITALAIDTTNNNTSAFSSCFNVVVNSNPVIPYCNNSVATFICDSFPTAINQFPNFDFPFLIYPNPTSGEFQIQLVRQKDGLSQSGAAGNWQLASSQKQEASIEIYNVYGEKVIQNVILSEAKNLTIDLSSQPSGIYFVKVNTESKQFFQKIIISK